MLTPARFILALKHPKSTAKGSERSEVLCGCRGTGYDGIG